LADSEDKFIEGEEISKEDPPAPLEVKVVNKEVKQSSPYDGHDDYEHDDLNITKEQREEFENGDSR